MLTCTLSHSIPLYPVDVQPLSSRSKFALAFPEDEMEDSDDGGDVPRGCEDPDIAAEDLCVPGDLYRLLVWVPACVVCLLVFVYPGSPHPPTPPSFAHPTPLKSSPHSHTPAYFLFLLPSFFPPPLLRPLRISILFPS